MIGVARMGKGINKLRIEREKKVMLCWPIETQLSYNRFAFVETINGDRIWLTDDHCNWYKYVQCANQLHRHEHIIVFPFGVSNDKKKKPHETMTISLHATCQYNFRCNDKFLSRFILMYFSCFDAQYYYHRHAMKRKNTVISNHNLKSILSSCHPFNQFKPICSQIVYWTIL